MAAGIVKRGDLEGPFERAEVRNDQLADQRSPEKNAPRLRVRCASLKMPEPPMDARRMPPPDSSSRQRPADSASVTSTVLALKDSFLVPQSRHSGESCPAPVVGLEQDVLALLRGHELAPSCHGYVQAGCFDQRRQPPQCRGECRTGRSGPLALFGACSARDGLASA